MVNFNRTIWFSKIALNYAINMRIFTKFTIKSIVLIFLNATT